MTNDTNEPEIFFDDFEDIPREEQIARWENVLRVLDAMPEHERQKHWDMGTWGEKTGCGTVACAAGHCGLDPWFRMRGFRLDFFLVEEPDEENPLGEWEDDISDVDSFFGDRGSDRIFYNSTVRPVETVIAEVKAYLEELRA